MKKAFRGGGVYAENKRVASIQPGEGGGGKQSRKPMKQPVQSPGDHIEQGAVWKQKMDVEPREKLQRGKRWDWYEPGLSELSPVEESVF